MDETGNYGVEPDRDLSASYRVSQDRLKRRSNYTGCMLGGAVGDALGAPVEFIYSSRDIFRKYGSGGIRDYVAVPYGRLGAITDDTQMSLFTSEGLIRADNLNRERRTGFAFKEFLYASYLRWLETQGERPSYPRGVRGDGWLIALPELHHRRAPGNTVMGALTSNEMGTMERPLNQSKGCGGVMRVAPVGLAGINPFQVGCESAAITHGHASGYLSAGFLASLISSITAGQSLPEAIGIARSELTKYHGHHECLAAVDQAVRASMSAPPNVATIESLGQGWVGEEALAISLYCALVADDFEHGVVLAVNHGGDSDSTGAITGNILGAMWGKEAIPMRWLAQLELHAEIETVGSDLFRHFGIAGGEMVAAEDWDRYPG